MTSTEGGPASPEGGQSKPTQDDRDRDHDGITGKSAAEGETAPDDDQVAIDLDLARDRAS